MKSESHSAVFDSLQPHGLYSPWNSPGQNTGVGNLSLLQGILPSQGLNPGLPYCKRILYQLNHKGSPWDETCLHITHIYWVFHVALVVEKNNNNKPACQCRRHKRGRFNSWVEKIPWRRAWQLTPVFLPGESHGQSILLQRVRNDWSNWACMQLTFTGPRSGENVSVTVLEKWRQLPIPPQAYSGPN